MTREQEIASSVDRLCRFLGRSARKVKIETLRRKGEIKAKLPFGVDGCIKIDRRYLLVQILDVSTIPDRIIRAKACLGANTSIIILACASADAEAVDIASEIADDAMENGLGLAFESSDEVYGVFPPGFAAVAPTTDSTEFGHIPHWLVAAVEAASGFSTYFHDCFVRFAEEYRALTSTHAPSSDDEFELLYKFVKELSHGDRRLFWPLSQLHVLKEWERTKVDPKGRDHVFHTFNNLFLGALLLVNLMTDRGLVTPETFIADTSDISKLAPWEVLWTFTCLFHDPGYVAEKFGASVNFTRGIKGLPESELEIPAVVIKFFRDAWDTVFAAARHDLCTLVQELTGTWTTIRSERSVWPRFDAALKVAYFYGRYGLHSLLSGLRLIEFCSAPGGVAHGSYDSDITEKTCVIAALCMLFHDQKCRKIFLEHGIQPISFEQLPYAAMLMYVDALQEDRRDVFESSFPARGFLQEVYVDGEAKSASVVVSLKAIPLKYWPYK